MSKDSAEVVIVGGGSTGISIAFHLARLGQKNIILVEKKFIAFGSTGRSAAVIRCHYPHKETSKMALRSLEFWENFAKQVGGPDPFVRTGLLILVTKEDEDKMRKTVEMHKDLGIEVGLLSRDEIVQLEPRLDIKDIVLGAYEPRGGYADSSAAATSLASRAREMGVEILEKTKLTGIETSGGRIKAVRTDKGQIETKKIVCATGIWSQEVGKMISTPFPIELKRENIVIIKHPPNFGKTHPIVMDVTNDAYYRPEGTNRTFIGDSPSISPESLGITEEVFRRTYLDPDWFKESLEPDEVRSFISRAIARFPVFEKALLQGGWAGVSDFTPDGFPILCELQNLEGFYCAFGMSGHGFKLAPAMGKAMAELISDGKTKDVSLDEYKFSRFEEGKPILPTLKYGAQRSV